MEHLHLLPTHNTVAQGPRGRALFGSIAAHAVVAAVLLWVTYVGAQKAKDAFVPPPPRIVWVAMPGPSGGGGGSKVTMPTPPPPKPPEAKKTLQTPAPVVVPDQITPPAPEPAEQQPPIAVIAETPSSGAVGPPGIAPGNGKGGGVGDGDGQGVGPGKDKGFGGGAYLPGNGVSSPQPTFQARPQYTAEAMRARVQGTITIECVVEPNGQCGDVRVVRAITPPFGLDQQALDAARKWRFRPGMRDGQPVPVLVQLVLDFTIH